MFNDLLTTTQQRWEMKGREVGRKEGREEGELNAILIMLEMALGEQNAQTKEQVKALVERDGFKAIAARILKDKSIEDVLAS